MSTNQHDKQWCILTDVTKCIGCEKCVEACREQNDLPDDKPWRWVKNITDLSTSRWTTRATCGW